MQEELFNITKEKKLSTEELDTSCSHRETIEVNDPLAFEIYFEIYKILHDPPLYAWFDSNYRTLEQTFIIQAIKGVVYVNDVHDCMFPVNKYHVKDFLIQEDGKWKPNWEAIKNIKIYY